MPVSSEGTWKKKEVLEKRANIEKIQKDQEPKNEKGDSSSYKPGFPATGPEVEQPQSDRE